MDDGTMFNTFSPFESPGKIAILSITHAYHHSFCKAVRCKLDLGATANLLCVQHMSSFLNIYVLLRDSIKSAALFDVFGCERCVVQIMTTSSKFSTLSLGSRYSQIYDVLVTHRTLPLALLNLQYLFDITYYMQMLATIVYFS